MNRSMERRTNETDGTDSTDSLTDEQGRTAAMTTSMTSTTSTTSTTSATIAAAATMVTASTGDDDAAAGGWSDDSMERGCHPGHGRGRGRVRTRHDGRRRLASMGADAGPDGMDQEGEDDRGALGFSSSPSWSSPSWSSPSWSSPKRPKSGLRTARAAAAALALLAVASVPSSSASAPASFSASTRLSTSAPSSAALSALFATTATRTHKWPRLRPSPSLSYLSCSPPHLASRPDWRRDAPHRPAASSSSCRSSSSRRVDGSGGHCSPGPASPLSSFLAEVDVRHGLRTGLAYDETLGRYAPVPASSLSSSSHGMPHGVADAREKEEERRALSSRIVRLLRSSFLPEGVSSSYYSFMRWRILQRFVNANVHVFGTQSLLLALGIKNRTRGGLGLSAAFNWVLKDALGKIVRMVWASRMGRKFDSDAKRWRYRSSLLFAAGNGLEVSTYVFPEWFLLCATLANCFKQMSMLTSSATRNALYNSFRDMRRQNIGDITAKGEAQIAVVDLAGIASGVCLSRAVGLSIRSVLSVWIMLQVIEIFCMYHEIRSVEFSMLNYERMWQITDTFVTSAYEQGGPSPKSTNVTADAMALGIPTPRDVARKERIFLPPSHLARRAIAFGSLGRAKLAPDELDELMDIFRREKFLLIVGEDVKNRRGRKKKRRRRINGSRSWNRGDGSYESRERGGISGIGGIGNGIAPHTPSEPTKKDLERARFDAMVNCHIVLHADANNADIVKSTLALAILRKKLAETAVVDLDANENVSAPSRRSRDCMDLIRQSRVEADKFFPRFLNVLGSRGWATPARFMFGRVSMRAEWPIHKASGPGLGSSGSTLAPGSESGSTLLSGSGSGSGSGPGSSSSTLASGSTSSSSSSSSTTLSALGQATSSEMAPAPEGRIN